MPTNDADIPASAEPAAAPAGPDAAPPVQFKFLRGREDALARERTETHDDAVAYTKRCLTEVLNAPNLAFLLGAGCSSHKRAGQSPQEVGIPGMGDLAREFFETDDDGHLTRLSKEECETLDGDGIKTDAASHGNNLERFMEVLHAARFYMERVSDPDADELGAVIGKVEAFLLDKCLNGPFAAGDDTVSTFYKKFFRKLVYRDRSLPRPWIFTSNYDLFAERALDSLGINYCNGFSGVVDRTFNPATFKYALAEQLDVSTRKWSVVDNHLYLCKLHGSVNWITDPASGTYGIREVQNPLPVPAGSNVMIFPTPLKHHATLASPYTDLFREFQSHIVREQTVLVCIGYSFGDEHIDALIHQALTVPTFRLVVFGSDAHAGIKKLLDLDDPRIWIIHGKTPDGASVHYFDYVTTHFLPDLPSDRIDNSVSKVVELIREGLRPPKLPGGSTS